MDDSIKYEFKKGEVIKKTPDDSKTIFFALNEDGLGVAVKEIKYGDN